MMFDEFKKGAEFDATGMHRLKLWRVWNGEKPKLMFIMLNPSTANGHTNDPTITRCMRFANDNGYGGIYVGNLFSIKSTDPKLLLSIPKPIHSKNERALIEMALQCQTILCAWGNPAIIQKMAKVKNPFKQLMMLSQTRGFFCLGKTKNGSPRHPLYVRANANFQTFKIPRI